MMPRLVLFLSVAGLLIAACNPLPSVSTQPAPGVVTPTHVYSPTSPGANSIPCNDILELSFTNDRVYDNKFFAVQLEVIFHSPKGAESRVNGFYYDADVWKARFRPGEPGRWSYTYVMTGNDGFREEGSGSFECTPSEVEGLVRPDPGNRNRWVLSNGAPYFPIGLENCVVTKGAQLASLLIDGEMRGSGEMRQVSFDEYFSINGQAGFNLFRFSPRNCSYELFDDLDHYRSAEMMATDELLALARKHGLRVMFGFFGSYKQATTGDGNLIAKQKRYLAYCVARWGVYADFWELLNESQATPEWATTMAEYVRSVDPDHKPVSISDPKPDLAAIDINAPHWYESENELQSDMRVQQQAANWKRSGKPVIVGEQGNTGMNWDPRSGLRMRVRAWTALFQEITLIFWNTSWAKNGMFEGIYRPGGAANIYLGPEERGYIHVLHDFSSRLEAGMQIVSIQVSAPDRVRAYGLASSRLAAAYLHHFESHTTEMNDLKITLDLPPASGQTGEWVDPANGNVLAREPLSPGRQTIAVPSFVVDLALLVTQK